MLTTSVITFQGVVGQKIIIFSVAHKINDIRGLLFLLKIMKHKGLTM